MGPLVLGGGPGEATATIKQSVDGTAAEIHVTLPAGVLGPDPVPLPPMALEDGQPAEVVAWGIRFILENKGDAPADVLEAIATALRQV